MECSKCCHGLAEYLTGLWTRALTIYDWEFIREWNAANAVMVQLSIYWTMDSSSNHLCLGIYKRMECSECCHSLAGYLLDYGQEL